MYVVTANGTNYLLSFKRNNIKIGVGHIEKE